MDPGVERCELCHGDGVTELSVGSGQGLISAELRPWVADRVVFVVTAAPIRRLHGDCLSDLGAAARQWTVLEVPDGEAAKTPEVARDLWHRILEAGGRRDSRVLTFGGGAVCDIGGFVAGTFMRGIELSHVPTTLLAQVDAAVGGKAAINLAAAKNSVGVFHQPQKVVSSTDLLSTLPPRQLRSGLVELIKMAMLLDGELLAAIERDLERLLVADASTWVPMVACAQRAKAGVVERDAREAGERRVLNFGHTLGHAIETAQGYDGLLHGEAVAHGMLFALQLAERRGLDPALGRRLAALLARLEVPPLPQDLRAEELMEHAGRDKKANRDGVVWVLPTGLEAWEAVPLSPAEVAAELASFLAKGGTDC
ncbi:MAG: 3-dehydroquinate synthase [Acidobacteria bacterium]|nr:3-dehydroquinate synthase [Acidobacteriota bacterium]